MIENWITPRTMSRPEPPKRPYIEELFLPDRGRRFGFRIGALQPGPNVVVTCEGQLARQVYLRLLLIPSLNRIRGTLYLLTVEPLGDLPAATTLRDLLQLGPVDGALNIPGVDLSALDEAAVQQTIRRNYWAVLRLCAKLGMIAGRGIPERDSPVA